MITWGLLVLRLGLPATVVDIFRTMRLLCSVEARGPDITSTRAAPVARAVQRLGCNHLRDHDSTPASLAVDGAQRSARRAGQILLTIYITYCNDISRDI